MIELELEGDVPAGFPQGDQLLTLVTVSAAAADVVDGHLAIHIVDAAHIHQLNLEHRAKDKPTDVLSFPIDGAGPVAGPREIGDVVICPEHTEDLTEAVVHGVLHLVGFDHEVDSGEMLKKQAEILSQYA